MIEEVALLTVSIVVFKNKAAEIGELCSNVLKSKLDVRLFLVDNSPTNKLQTELADLIKDDRVEYIFNNANVGFGAAHNIAIRQTIDRSLYHLVLNPDVTFDPFVLHALVAYMEENKAVGLVMPKVLYPDGEIQYACKLLPTPADLIFRRFLPFSFINRNAEHFELRKSGYDKEMEVPYLSGCFMFLRTEALKKVGLFDERFFMYPEDIDLTRRIHRQYKTMFFPKVSVIHEHGRGSYKSLKLLYIHITNMIKYFNKWGWINDKERRSINEKILAQFANS